MFRWVTSRPHNSSAQIAVDFLIWYSISRFKAITSYSFITSDWFFLFFSQIICHTEIYCSVIQLGKWLIQIDNACIIQRCLVQFSNRQIANKMCKVHSRCHLCHSQILITRNFVWRLFFSRNLMHPSLSNVLNCKVRGFKTCDVTWFLIQVTLPFKYKCIQK